ncbi:hypothetical protein [Magnetospira sp. QH-2]|uniref:hypothetical protein n=1 Tax=Magnetospira sp. (strain QH-2) TaxID=1288970 RepID=UPI0003E81510|nr:hypothetical protein [Magnetospira sp. QH-2]CCQ72737.1 Protein of unknown function [Magnetospira sp. QH-2]
MTVEARATLLAYLQDRARELLQDATSATMPTGAELRAEAEELMALHGIISHREMPAQEQLNLRFPQAA